MFWFTCLTLLGSSSSLAGPLDSRSEQVWRRSAASAFALVHPDGVRLVCPLPPGTWPSTALLFGRFRPGAFAMGLSTSGELLAGHLVAMVGVGETEAVFDIPSKGLHPFAGRLRATWEAGNAGQFATCTSVVLEELNCAALQEPCIQVGT